MAIPADETKRYYDFVNQLIKDLGTIAIPPDSMLWHYTNGTALIAIIETGTIFATQPLGSQRHHRVTLRVENSSGGAGVAPGQTQGGRDFLGVH